MVEIVNVGVTGLALLNRPRISKGKATQSDSSQAIAENTRVRFSYFNEAIDCPVYDRTIIEFGHDIPGPAIIRQYDSTTVIEPNWRAHADQWGNLVLKKTC